MRFSIFFPSFNKSVLKQQNTENGAKSVQTDILELLKFQNFLRVKEFSKSYLHVPLFLHFAPTPPPLKVGSAGLLCESVKK